MPCLRARCYISSVSRVASNIPSAYTSKPYDFDLLRSVRCLCALSALRIAQLVRRDKAQQKEPALNL